MLSTRAILAAEDVAAEAASLGLQDRLPGQRQLPLLVLQLHPVGRAERRGVRGAELRQRYGGEPQHLVDLTKRAGR